MKLGKGGAFFKPQYINLFGKNISIDNYPTLIGAKDANIQFTTWNIDKWDGKLDIGKYVLITPGVRIMAAEQITIGDACMFAHGITVYVRVETLDLRQLATHVHARNSVRM